MLTLFQKHMQHLLDIFNYLAQPSLKHCKDKDDYDVSHSRNKALLLVNIFANISFILNLIFGNGDTASNVNGLIAATFIITAMVVTNKLNIPPQVFRVIFTIYALTFEFLLIVNGPDGVIGTGLSAPIIPIFVYLITGSIHHYIINIGCGVLFINTFCEGIMRDKLAFLTVEETTKAFIYYSNQNIVYSFTYTALIHVTIHNVLYKVKVAEEKREDFEKQKNFLLGFSHELRNLINSLMGNVKLASLENLSDKVKELLLNAEVCSELLLHLVNNILDTGKVEIGELEINPVPTRVYDTIERIWSICSELIKRKNLRGKMKIQKDIPQILVFDHYRITQMFLNLIGNAVKYTDTGSIDVSVEWIPKMEEVEEKCFKPYPFNDTDEQDEGLFEKQQALSVFNENFIFLNFARKKIDKNQLAQRPNPARGVLKISVSDTGCGILSEDISKLFQRFTQGDNDPSKKKLGTGLGLFITKELCMRMRGNVQVFSKRGVGSTFIVCLPIQPVSNDLAFSFDLEEIQKVNHHHKLRAMIVDDERFSYFILRDFLTKLHVDVVDIAENGLIGYKRYIDREKRKDIVNIVTMDLNMPVMEGKVAAQKIREYEALRNMAPCLLIIVSGNCSESEINECLDKNGSIRADAFVKKPVSIDELCRIISCHFAQVYNQDRVRLLND